MHSNRLHLNACIAFAVLPDLKYAKSHEWAKAEGDVVTVGISDHAQVRGLRVI